eukprot:1218772-Rhodomonas_salina.1
MSVPTGSGSSTCTLLALDFSPCWGKGHLDLPRKLYWHSVSERRVPYGDSVSQCNVRSEG